MYFSKFDSFIQATEKSKSIAIVVERADGERIVSSAIPIEALEDALEEISSVEDGGPAHIWIALPKELIVIPNHQIVSVRLMFL